MTKENEFECPSCGQKIKLEFYLPIDEPVNEDITMVGNNKFWKNKIEEKIKELEL